MAGDQAMGGLAVTVLAPTLGQHEFFLRFQQGKLPDVRQVTVEMPSGVRDDGRAGRFAVATLMATPPFVRGIAGERAFSTLVPRLLKPTLEVGMTPGQYNSY
jgi:hypothetical protein